MTISISIDINLPTGEKTNWTSLNSIDMESLTGFGEGGGVHIY